MTPDLLHGLSARYAALRLAVVGDFCLDRYLEIDPSLEEISIETGLPVHNVVRVRSQAGGAGTILNNLVALGVGRLYPVGIAGEDGEGMELVRALRGQQGVAMDYFSTTPLQRTFTYCKPLLMHANRPPEELSRLDSKNWSRTPAEVSRHLVAAIKDLQGRVDGIILLDQVDQAETGVLTAEVREAVGALARENPGMPIVADSRRGLRGFPPVIFKMNRSELGRMMNLPGIGSMDEVTIAARGLAEAHGRAVIVTLAEEGLMGAQPGGFIHHEPAFPIKGEIDIVGAGDAVTANVSAALAAGVEFRDALQLANAAASIVIHQVGTTGTATVEDLTRLLAPGGKGPG